MKEKIARISSLLVIFLIMAAIAICKDHKLMGHEFTPATVSTDSVPAIIAGGNTLTVNTSSLVHGIIGYGGEIPLVVTIKDGVITDIKAERNAESPDFFSRASQVFSSWIGKTPAEAAVMEVDAITGATFSSSAIIRTMQSSMQQVAEQEMHRQVGEAHSSASIFSLRSVCVILVILLASVLPLFIHNNGLYRTIQQVLNVAVLGFWSGTFISFTTLIGWMSGGIRLDMLIAAILLIIVAFIYPIFGKPGHYCGWVCPLGSLQELCGKLVGYKLHIAPSVLKGLNYFRQALWAVLMFVLMSGLWFAWIDYELFTAFIVKSASVGVLIAAGIIVLLSLVVTRPYCRFICPTGCLLKAAQNAKK